MFNVATQNAPYPYQVSLATSASLPDVLHVPTGLGKTAAISLAWIWRRRFASEDVKLATPRRLIYCLPQRVLVEQTYQEISRWLNNLNILSGPARQNKAFGEAVDSENASISLHLLMGGDVDNDWEMYPERDVILVGTQDQLLSRALNRGYGMSRYKWPVHFAFLSNDSLWVIDEMQLQDVGLQTTSQLHALRTKLGTYGPSHTLWTSATFHPQWLSTVDFRTKVDSPDVLRLDQRDLNDERLARIVHAKKTILRQPIRLTKENAKRSGEDYAGLMAELLSQQHVPNTMTLVVVNQVQRAQMIYEAVRKAQPEREVMLIHSRFRTSERAHQSMKLRALEGRDCIVIATQAIEAGVDISAHTLITELAPWSSLIQRFGRCNRRGDTVDTCVVVIDIEGEKELAFPYSVEALERARTRLGPLTDVGPHVLTDVVDEMESQMLVLRKKDIEDFFDTSADLSGADVDVSRYIRSNRDVDVQVYWRDVLKDGPDKLMSRFSRDELCPVSLKQIRDYLGTKMKDATRRAWVWDGLSDAFFTVFKDDIYPGQTLLLDGAMGGYLAEVGFVPESTAPVQSLDLPAVEGVANKPDVANDDDYDSVIDRMVELQPHLADVLQEARELMTGVAFDIPCTAIESAAAWHDVGKAHPTFQALLGNDGADGCILAKSHTDKMPIKENRKNVRRGFRHELASALAFLHWSDTSGDGDDVRSLVAYLIAAHHGKVRTAIRSLPTEQEPPDANRLFARGIWHGDKLPVVQLGNEQWIPETVLDLRLMQMGFVEAEQTSWGQMVLDLLRRYGPFRLAYLEMVVRVADWRASAKEATR